jgi:uncharacterized protein
MEFEWDPSKDTGNQSKHGLSFSEASLVFNDPEAAIFDDPSHSDSEKRERIIGTLRNDQTIIVSFTERAQKIRIISARRANRKEKKLFEDYKKSLRQAG